MAQHRPKHRLKLLITARISPCDAPAGVLGELPEDKHATLATYYGEAQVRWGNTGQGAAFSIWLCRMHTTLRTQVHRAPGPLQFTCFLGPRPCFLLSQVLSVRAALYQIMAATTDNKTRIVYNYDLLHPTDLGHRWCGTHHPML